MSSAEAMMTSWTAAVHASFLQQIHDGQATRSATTPSLVGCIAGMVPASASFTSQAVGNPEPGRPIDIGFTAAFPLEAAELFKRFADSDTVKRQWPALTNYIDCQLRVASAANGTADLLPSFYVWGDWSTSVESRSASKAGAGARIAAANWLLALEAMASLARDPMSLDADAERYTQLLEAARRLYDARFWNATLGTWAARQTEVQTMTALSLAVGVGSAERRATATAALLRDIASRGDHMAVGYQGARWLLPSLSAAGQHDVALRLALQTSYPSFGHWLANGATSCWENWSGFADSAHPPHPSHNHIFLCGGVGVWLYESLGGIRPAAPGYARVAIAPQISRTLGPSAVNMTLQTLHGVVRSAWRRTSSVDDRASSAELLRLDVEIPIGVRARITVPLLRPAAGATRRVYLRERDLMRELWRSGSSADTSLPSATSDAVGSGSVRVVDGGLEVAVRGGGSYAFAVTT